MLKKRFGKRLGWLRKVRNLTQQDLSERVGVSVQYLGTIERGLSAPSFKVIERICLALEVSPLSLFLFLPEISSEAHAGCSDHAEPVLHPFQMSMIKLDLKSAQWAVSDSFYGLLGYRNPKKDYSFGFFLKHVPPQQRGLLSEAWFQTVAWSKKSSIKFDLTRIDGIVRSIRGYSDVLRGKSGEPFEAQWVLQDLTDLEVLNRAILRNRVNLEQDMAECNRQLDSALDNADREKVKAKEAHQALNSFKHSYRQIFNAISDAVYIHDVKGRILDANTVGHERLGYTRDEMLSLSASDVDLDHPTEKEVRERISSALSAGPLCIESRHITKDGHIINVELQTSTFGDREEKSFVTVARDITKRKMAETALEKSLKMLNRTESLAHVGSWEWDIATDTVTWSEELYRIFQLDPGAEAPNWAGHPKLYHPEDFEKLRHAAERAIADAKPYEMELRAFREDGQTRICKAEGFPEIDEAGQVFRLFGLLQDITDHRQVEEEFAQIFAMSLDMICIADIQSATFIKVNPAFTEILGYKQIELLERPFIDFIHPEDIDATRTVINRALNVGSKVINFENRYRCKDGSYRWFSWTSHPNTERGVTYAVARDITETKQNEEELRRNKALLDATNRMAKVGGWELDASTLEVTWTDETYRIHELPLDCKPPQLRDAINFFHPEDRGHLGQAVKNALDHGDGYDLEVRFITASGKELWTRTKCEPELVEGKVTKLKGTFQDISDRKTAEIKLIDSERRFRSLFEFMEEGFVRADKDGHITLANIAMAKMFGYESSDDMIALNMKTLYADPEERYNVIAKLHKTSALYNYELLVKSKEGHTFWSLCNLKILKDGHGKFIGTEGLVRDINDRKQAEYALAKSNRGLSVLKEAGKALLRTQDESTLIEQICRIIVQLGHYSLAWVGFSDAGPEKFVKAVGSWGVDANYLNGLNITWDDSETGKGPIGKAIRTQKVQVIKQISTASDYDFWRNAALKRGYHSSIAIPICHEHLCLGAVNIYSPEPDAFDESETDLLVQLTQELSYGIVSLRNKEAQMKAEEALRKSEDKYRRLTENSPDVIYRMSLPDGKYEYISPAAETIFGYPPEAWYEGRIHLQDFIHPDSYSYFKVQWGQMLKGHVPPTYEYRIVHANGAIRWLNQRNVPIISSDGSLIAIEGIVTDITERKEAENALQESYRRFLTVLDSIDVNIYVVDIESYQILFMNKSMIESFDNDMTGDVCWKLYGEQSSPCSNCPIDKLSHDNRKTDDVVFWQNKNNITGKWYVNYAKLLEWIDGRSVQIQVSTDITEIKRMEDELRQAHKMEAIGTLAGGIAHEFNNMLGIIIGNTELALDDIPNWSSAREFLGDVKTASLRAKDVVRKLLSVARKTPMSLKPIHVRSIIEDSLKLMRRMIPTTIDIRENLACLSEMILGDPTEISQVMINLCTNSVHAMASGKGILEVGLDVIRLDQVSALHYEDLSPGSYVRLTVKDTGEGIEPTKMYRIFDPYFTTKEVNQGLGMGLAVVYGIVKNHQGSIKFQSTVGEGTTAEVLFPMIENQDVFSIEQTETLSKGTERILLVDDEPSLVKIVTKMLKGFGYEVIGKTSSSEALAIFKESPDRFDLLISDMAMPELSGEKLAKEILNIRPDFPIIICTGHSEFMDEYKAKELGIRSFVFKPLTKSALIVTVQKALHPVHG